MGTRKNAKFLSITEKENFVKACVLMKADIVNPLAAPAARYSKWDEYIAIHLKIQAGIAPGNIAVNFGHGGSGAFSFLSWHRYFLYQFEQQLQSYVPGVMLPYWDWTDPASIMTDSFLGPNGNAANNNIIERGYFAVDKPGAGANPTPLPAWWPASLDGWRLPAMFPSNLQGGLRRQTGVAGNLPTVANINTTMSQPDYAAFQFAAESGPRMHDNMHVWLGGGNTCGSSLSVGHMTCAAVSPFEPLFYLHHCNIDRLWAMWQLDGHQDEYPNVGGRVQHHRTDIMYPWTGGTPGYGTNSSLAIPMPDFSGLGIKRNEDTLDFRNAFGYTYDTIAVIGLGLDRTGSMNGITPDPMVSGAPDVSKWEAAKRGVSAFLQDSETVQSSRAVYVVAGIKAFRSFLGNNFTQLFAAPGNGLIKTGSAFSKASFEAAVAALTPGGGTPLADALLDVQNTVVEAAFGGEPSDEQRYIAMLTDGILTSGAPLASIPNGSMNNTAIFAMGFGTGLDVDYATLAAMVAKGKTLLTPQIFHGENAGTIDKFFSNALAAAIGFTSVFDPVVELFEGEHTHLSFTATSADDAFLITAQGMDFVDKNWSYMLHGPGGQVLYGNDAGHDHAAGCDHCCPSPSVTASRSNGRISVMVQRGTAAKDCWVGAWVLLISYKSKLIDSMFMPELGEILFPVAAGPIKGQRYARLLTRPRQRKATRNVVAAGLHGLDFRGVGTNNNDKEACNVVVNIYARTNLQLSLKLNKAVVKQGEELEFTLASNIVTGRVKYTGGLARLVSPAFDLNNFISKQEVLRMIHGAEKTKKYSSKFDFALLLAKYEREKRELVFINDAEVKVVSHGNSPLHIHHKDTAVRGIFNLGLIVEGLYYPDAAPATGGHHHETNRGTHGPVEAETNGQVYEPFSRVLNISGAIE
jgi:hypothetical protein